MRLWREIPEHLARRQYLIPDSWMSQYVNTYYELNIEFKDSDNPRCLVVFSKYADRDSEFMSIMSVDGESMDIPDFEPFTAIDGYISLQGLESDGFIEVVKSKLASEVMEGENNPTFLRRISTEEANSLHLYTEPDPGVERRFYMVDSEQNSEDVIELIIIAKDVKLLKRNLLFCIMCFEKSRMLDSDFMPEQHATASIHVKSVILREIIREIMLFL